MKWFSLSWFGNARKWSDWLESRTTQVSLGIGVILVAGVIVGSYRPRPAPPSPESKVSSSATDSAPVSHNFNIPVFNIVPPQTSEPQAPAPVAPPAPKELPLSLYSAESTGEKEVSESYAPYGRLIPCETVVTIDSARIDTPIIGLVTDDVYHEGRLIIPAGAEVHGKAQTDRSRERIASDGQWMIVWRTTDRLNGAELPLKGIALDRERDASGWAITDGSAGLRGAIIKTDNMAEIKLFAATFLAAAASGLQDTSSYTNPYTGGTGTTVLDSPKNAALQATSSVITEYARQIQDSIKKDGFYVRVAAGKQFYLYVTQTIDQDEARKAASQIKDLKPSSTLNPKPKSITP